MWRSVQTISRITKLKPSTKNPRLKKDERIEQLRTGKYLKSRTGNNLGLEEKPLEASDCHGNGLK